MIFIVLLIAAVSFTLSASAGLGGSLILVPALAVILGPKEGIALAALFLACNNVAKVVVYRNVIPLRDTFTIIIATMVGTAMGSTLLYFAPASWISIAIVIAIFTTFIFERRTIYFSKPTFGSFLAFCAGATSGFSGTSGPLKGIAIRNLNLDRQHFVGAASAVSLAGDAIKVGIFLSVSLLSFDSLVMLTAALPIMVIGTSVGKRINSSIGERGYAALFWTIMFGYSLRLVFL